MRYEFAGFILDPDAFELLRDGEVLDVQPKVIDLLRVLLEHPGALVTRDALHAAVWPDVVVSDDGLFQLVTKARKALEDDPKAPRFIETVRGRGYRFVAPVRQAAAQAPGPAPGGFFGRASELASLERLFATQRLVTVTGPGGIGKTRLVLQHARGRVHAFCDAAAATDLYDFARAVARSVGAGLPATTSEDLVERLGAYLASLGTHLVVLDNLEQVATEAARAVERWLEQAPAIRFLATSRRRLALPQERVLALGPLDAGSAEALFRHHVRARFGEHAAGSEHVPALVARLDHVPLAIELAAARVGVLPVRGLLERLGRRLDLLGGGAPDGVDRHDSVRAAIDWSWEILDDAQRRVALCCAPFRGGFTLEAAEAVAGGPVLDVLAQLRDRSWVHRRPGEDRLRLLETLRAYLDERVEESDDPGRVHEGHARWVASLCPPFTVPDESLLRAESDNIQIAVARDLPPALRVACTWTYWRAFRYWGSWARTREVIERACREARDLDPGTRFVAEYLRLDCAMLQGRWEDLEARNAELRRLAQASGDPALLAWADSMDGFVGYKRGRMAEARDALGRACDWFEAAGDGWGLVSSWLIQAHVERESGLHREATRGYRRVERLAAELGQDFLAGYAAMEGGEVHQHLLEIDEAIASCTRARDLLARAGVDQVRVDAEASLAMLAGVRGDLQRAEADLTAARDEAARLGTFTFHIDWERAAVLVELGRFEEAEALFPYIEERLATLHPLPRAQFQVVRAMHALARGDVAAAEAFHARADQLLAEQAIRYWEGHNAGLRAICALLLGDDEAAARHAARAHEMLPANGDPTSRHLLAVVDGLLAGHTVDEAVAAAVSDGRPLWFRLRRYIAAAQRES